MINTIFGRGIVPLPNVCYNELGDKNGTPNAEKEIYKIKEF